MCRKVFFFSNVAKFLLNEKIEFLKKYYILDQQNIVPKIVAGTKVPTWRTEDTFVHNQPHLGQSLSILPPDCHINDSKALTWRTEGTFVHSQPHLGQSLSTLPPDCYIM